MCNCLWNSSLQCLRDHFFGYLFKNIFLVLKKIFKDKHYVENLDVGEWLFYKVNWNPTKLTRRMFRARRQGIQTEQVSKIMFFKALTICWTFIFARDLRQHWNGKKLSGARPIKWISCQRAIWLLQFLQVCRKSNFLFFFSNRYLPKQTSGEFVT